MFKHQLKKRVFDKAQKRYRDVVVHTNARFGSGILDCHGHQIFEGDTVKVFGDEIFTVTFEEGRFKIGKYAALWDFPKAQLEIIKEGSHVNALSQD